MDSNSPIGFFDSGVGGTSIWKAIHLILPYENTIYLADSKNAPYGSQSPEEIIALSIKNTEFLLEANCKLIVVACNTATTNAINVLRSSFNVPFVGIEPAIKPAANQSKTQAIGILATQGTLNSALFHKNLQQYDHIKIVEQMGHGLVQLIENGAIDSKEMDKLLQKYLQPMIDANIDFLVLGCSHYPYLVPKISEILPKHIQIIDSGEAVARQTKNVLENHSMLNKNEEISKTVFYSNGNPKILENILENKYQVFYKNF